MPPTSRLGTVPEPGLGLDRSAECVSARSVPSHAQPPRHTMTRARLEDGHLRLEEREARVAFLGRRLVVGRCAAVDRGEPCTVWRLSPSAADTTSAGSRGPRGSSAREQEVPRAVPGEHPTGPVGAVRGRCEADDEDPRPGSPKPGTGRPQYTSSANRVVRSHRDPLPPLDEAWTPRHVTTRARSSSSRVSGPVTRPTAWPWPSFAVVSARRPRRLQAAPVLDTRPPPMRAASRAVSVGASAVPVLASRTPSADSHSSKGSRAT